ncbi:sigma-70 family RNA polymerase sigma factor [Nannocystis sp. ILAH1]|uniref:RNA polymerase sigma factor n=1 Tax=unclassified Nannocystis TaxID=2627009 RepID=UPI0022702906|nr:MULTISPECIES: sigma-70 family RNA polymerase sigma factor [unclassified Nannocystis]MCY0992241.1 sigma-70 family RNA polymerase sigma factor [Nannocystis sp. ILAH1]MCY1069171.1 sigma-70 family RNA polymerase sigma factor [Nannocystis sp. RBIL2]
MHVPATDHEPGRDDDPRRARFYALYRREFDFVWAAARRFGVPPVVLDDVVQEVFITAYRRLDELRYEVSPRAWLFAVTRRIAWRYRRGAARQARRVAALAEVLPAAHDAPHQRLDTAQQLEQSLAQLAGELRAVWEMTELLGMSGPEVASELALPVNTVYSRLRLARGQLQARLGEAELAASAEQMRRRDAAPPGRAQRTWVLLGPVLGKTGAVGTLGALATTRTAVAATLIVAGGATMHATERGAGPRPPPPARGAERGETVLSPKTGAIAARSEPSADPPPPVPRATAASPPAKPDRLSAEVSLLDQARGRLDEGAAAVALALLVAHAREFPRGALVDAREAARVDALCQLNRAAEAEAVAQRLVVEFPTSALVQQFEHYVCAR